VAFAKYRVTQDANNPPKFTGGSCSGDAVFRHFDLGDSAEREEQLNQIFWGVFDSSAHDVADGGSYGRVEKDISRLQSGEIHAHCLSGLEGSQITPRTKLCASSPPIANRVERSAPLYHGAGISPAIFRSPMRRAYAAAMQPALPLCVLAARYIMRRRSHFSCSGRNGESHAACEIASSI
jgi:hypothetical protein